MESLSVEARSIAQPQVGEQPTRAVLGDGRADPCGMLLDPVVGDALGRSDRSIEPHLFSEQDRTPRSDHPTLCGAIAQPTSPFLQPHPDLPSEPRAER
jgi:hypothetical protein